MTSANRAAVSGPMSRPRPDAPNGVSSIASARRHDVLRVGAELRGHDDIGRQHELHARFLGALDVLAHRVELVGLEQARADLVPLRGEEGEQHPAADEQPVDARQQVRDDAELVAHLRAAEHDRVRPLGVLGEAVEHVELRGDQQAGCRRQDLGEVVDARLLAVHDAEAVGDEHVAQVGELLGERATLRVVLRRLARVEAQVLDDRDVAVLERRDGLVGGLVHRVEGERDGLAEQLRQPLGDRARGCTSRRARRRAGRGASRRRRGHPG